MILMTCVIKDSSKFYLQIFLEEALVAYKLLEIGKSSIKVVQS